MARRGSVLKCAALATLFSVSLITAAPVVALSSPAVPDFDFDGDGAADVAIVRNEGGPIRWWIQGSAGMVSTYPFGIDTDFFVPADYDGDGLVDVAIWRNVGTPSFYILQSTTGTVRVEPFGLAGDDPAVVGDWDGDGKADVAVWRVAGGVGAQGTFYYLGSLNNPAKNITSIPWGVNGDFPMPGDYDGDGKYDPAVSRSVGGQAQNWILRSSDGFVEVLQFGLDTDSIVPGEYDGDGKSDLMMVRTSGANVVWWLLTRTGAVSVQQWGLSASDFLIGGDYDADGRSDVSVYRPGGGSQGRAWVRRSSDLGLLLRSFGTGVDYPVANAYVH